jgi:hypothetical protein
MDPIQIITASPLPPEVMIPLMLVAFTFKLLQLIILRNSDDDSNTPAVG